MSHGMIWRSGRRRTKESVFWLKKKLLNFNNISYNQDDLTTYKKWTNTMSGATSASPENLEQELRSIISQKREIKWRKMSGEMLDVDYGILLPESLGRKLMDELERSVEYYTGDLTRVKVFGKLHQIPRQQVAYGDPGLKYTFSGTTIEAKRWPPLLDAIRHLVQDVTNYKYNFVLVNRYRNGYDHIGEHRDDEKELDKNTPIASLSLGQSRTFIFKHKDVRLKGKLKRNVPLVKLELEHGSLLLMNHPTNEYWYHSLPPRKKCVGVRINFTFRQINLK